MAPSAADSVGVAQPPDMAPTTTIKIDMSGSNVDDEQAPMIAARLGFREARAGARCGERSGRGR